jgi:hypothetical protein
VPDNGAYDDRGLLWPERFRPLLELMRASDTEPRFERPDRPAHTYAQTTRRTLTAQLNAKTAARPDSHSGRAA